MREQHPFGHKLIQERGIQSLIPLKMGIKPPKIIRHDQHDIGLLYRL